MIESISIGIEAFHRFRRGLTPSLVINDIVIDACAAIECWATFLKIYSCSPTKNAKTKFVILAASFEEKMLKVKERKKENKMIKYTYKFKYN